MFCKIHNYHEFGSLVAPSSNLIFLALSDANLSITGLKSVASVRSLSIKKSARLGNTFIITSI